MSILVVIYMFVSPAIEPIIIHCVLTSASCPQSQLCEYIYMPSLDSLLTPKSSDRSQQCISSAPSRTRGGLAPNGATVPNTFVQTNSPTLPARLAEPCLFVRRQYSAFYMLVRPFTHLGNLCVRRRLTDAGFTGYILFQVPSNMFLNKIGKPSLYIPACEFSKPSSGARRGPDRAM